MNPTKPHKRLFEPGYAYPSDREGGAYVDLEGIIIAVVDNPIFDWWRVDVETKEHGPHSAFVTRVGDFPPKVGYHARIRVYAAGGGHYPDNKLTGWSSAPYETKEQP